MHCSPEDFSEYRNLKSTCVGQKKYNVIPFLNKYNKLIPTRISNVNVKF